MDTATLADLVQRAQALRPALDRVEQQAAQIGKGLPGPDTPPADLPPRTDWSWRPAPWCGPLSPLGIAGLRSGHVVAEGVTVHHDCPQNLITLRQAAVDGRWEVSLDWSGFAGSYLSMVVALPPAGLAGLSPDHVLSLSALRGSEVGGSVFARLNIRNGPNVAQSSQHGGFAHAPERVEFDLAYMTFEPARVTEVWIDLIFEARSANRVSLADVVLTRHRRATL